MLTRRGAGRGLSRGRSRRSPRSRPAFRKSPLAVFLFGAILPAVGLRPAAGAVIDSTAPGRAVWGMQCIISRTQEHVSAAVALLPVQVSLAG